MASSNPLFFKIWRDEKINRQLLSHLDDDNLCALRLTNTACSNIVTRPLFARIHLTFTPSALSRPSRMEALARIGHHVGHLTFSMPHTESTFLPPLLNPVTGREVNFLYTPHTSLASETERPKYGTHELADYLTQQYPPIFHAATNVPAFIRALACMPNLRHLSVSCPGQEPCQRYRRSAVDYALISLRIAIERAGLTQLEKLSLAVHPAALLYLHPTPNFGASPSGLRRWRQIRNLKMSIDSWAFENSRADHLKLLTNYIRTFSSSLEKLTFHWYGQRGPCPLTLNDSSRPSSPSSATKLFAEITSPMSPLPETPPPPPLHFPHLRRLFVRNAWVAAEQVSSLVSKHGSSLRTIDFDNVILTSGSWDEALAPLNDLATKEGIWEARHSGSSSGIGFGSQPRSHMDDDVFDNSSFRNSSGLFVQGELGTAPCNTHLHKRVRKRRRAYRRAATPSPPPTLRRQASSLLDRLKHSAMEASQSTFFSRFIHNENSSSSLGLAISEPVARSPLHNREMPPVPEQLSRSPSYNREIPPIPEQPSVPELSHPSVVLQPATYTPPTRLATPPRPTTPVKRLSPLLPATTFVPEGRIPSPEHVHPLRRSPPESASTQSTSSYHQSPESSPPKRSPQTPDPPHTPWPSAMALKPKPLNPAVRGVQRNLQRETHHQELVDDAEKRIHALRQGREAILQRLGKQFTARSSAAASIGDRQVQREVKLNMMTGGSGMRAIGDGMNMGMGMQKGMMVPLMIFR
ncbi:hypothetical protein VE01_01345 [Pseudogymnoascus verrucosus]|uniref:Uncharacterized protein n=1 Tax=Pseudogymnoascus verrucosus TaxID=342668 RepID=A0A1B8GXW7_9PEZI|nr:uncharacterized protein VE01_01345 [Pseudogymnoascus verrucosus]OBU00670.1 hypothetical protein VE01_01345 [Pseudogymnoascus verrucosus]